MVGGGGARVEPLLLTINSLSYFN